ncbi:AraC family transcriptional regulator [Vibrio europaeus]|uniref:AraC family transcriptional regulator n=1 Tax=Vibrio europaeus TaxID=300876 RepID=A0AAE7ATP7_9VIBR|nr:AraC family transcriptional regulator [Vibrio europaeus]MDC5803507.1 AraC family transcriptional regulator [Vibrio europaeus]MDC5823379.1 AraC family transcriptional regulator [Vibrio europaeus]MDC5828783.1 AraC family transcriptional regulator [Vibrio europaeus]MDC5833112.1 AraC family transcriptional regulator [Vibrio europaeus]NOH23476.1 AraC family transcriptional regulator [Vibrio europaeus]
MEYSAVYEPDMQAFGILDVQLLTRYLENQIPVEELLEGSGISLAELYSPETHITLAQKLIIFSNAVSLSNEPDLGLKVGQQARFSDFGVLGYAAFSSSTLLDALLLGFKYLRLAGPVLRKKMWIEQDRGYFRAEQLIALDSLLPFCCEYWFAAIQNLCEEVMQQPFPSYVLKFPYPKPEYGDAYNQLFRCQIEFNCQELEWEFDASSMHDPLPSANTMTLQMCLKSCDEMLAKVSSTPSLKEKITQMFVESPGSYPSIEVLSAELGMSSRTLRRHLKAEQTSYQQLLDHVRFQLAKHYLASTGLNIEEISERVGFSDSANFRHAFRRWSGYSPKQFRNQAITTK